MHLRREQFQHIVAGGEPMLRLAIRNQARQEHGAVLAGLPADLLDAMIDNALQAGRSYGLQSPVDLGTFVLWCFEFGPEFHRHPAIRAVLSDAALAPGEKLPAVLQRVPEQAWRDCEAALHRMTWFPELREAQA